MNNIVWLASYPKSGNTWFRIFLINLLRNEDKPVNINEFGTSIPIASANQIFTDALGFEIADLSHDEADELRSDVYDYIARDAGETIYMKIHDAYTYKSNGGPLVSLTATKSTLYFIRNPLDIAISFANHSGISIDKSIERMNDELYCFCDKTDRYQNQLRQRLLSWSKHVQSWVNAENMDVHIIRYEDMKENPIEVFSEAVWAAGLIKSHDEILKALKYSHFDEMRRQEQEYGFVEKTPECNSFFNRGESGYWRSVLSDSQVESIIDTHGQLMKKFGYLTDSGEPL